jgi:hypothetical protein
MWLASAMIGQILGFRMGAVGVFFLPGRGAKIIGGLVPDFSVQSSGITPRGGM